MPTNTTDPTPSPPPPPPPRATSPKRAPRISLRDRVILYDYTRSALSIQSKTALDADPHAYHILPLARGQKKIALYVDVTGVDSGIRTSPDYRPPLSSTAGDTQLVGPGSFYSLLAILTLTKFGVVDWVLLKAGWIREVYVPESVEVEVEVEV